MTPTPAPALTDEQMGSTPADDAQIDDDARALVEGESMPEETAWAIIAAVIARAKREEREAISTSGVMHVWGFLSGRDDLVSDVQVALCPGELHEVANHVINDASEHGYDVKSWTVRSLDGYLREVHAVWAVDPDMPMWHRFVTPSTPWVQEPTR